jgi:hypothetical protein
MSARMAAAVLALLATGCRPEPGPSDYVSQEDFHFDAGSAVPSGFVEGPDPGEAGTPRFKLGLFYEGGSTEEVVVDDVAAHFYVYEQTFSVGPVDEGQREGLQADALMHAGGPWWGGGIHWDTARDLSGWAQLRVSLRSTSEVFDDVKLGMASGAEGSPSRAEARVSVADYGFKADGEWHDLRIPLADLVAQGIDLTEVTIAFSVGGGSGTAADTLLIDALYLTAD